MSKPKAPRSIEDARELLARHAELEGHLATIEARRARGLARVNAVADLMRNRLLLSMRALQELLEPWFREHKADILPTGRKTAELGGCYIGTRKSRAKLQHSFNDEDEALAALMSTRLKKQTTRVTYEIDRTATIKLLLAKGKTAETLQGMGFSLVPGNDRFFVERVDEGRTFGGS